MINHELELLLKEDYVNSDKMLVLIKKYQWTKKLEHKLELRDEIFNNNIRLIRKIVVKGIGNNSEDLEDVFNSAVIEFFKGLDKFDVKQGSKLSTYISYWIEKAVHEYYYSRHIIHIPKASFSNKNKIDLITKAKKAANNSLVYLDAPVLNSDGQKSSAHEVIADEKFENIEDSILTRLDNAKVMDAVKKLSEREQIIIKCKFFSDKEMTLKEISQICKVGPERVRYCLHIALRKLRKLVSDPDRLDKDNRQFEIEYNYAPETDFDREMRFKFAIPRVRI